MAQSDPIPPAAQRQILVVDDDWSVRKLLVRILAEDGYSAWAAADSTEALGIGQAVGLDLAILDLGLPGKSGWELFERLIEVNPALAVIIITAKPDQRTVAQASGVGAFFEKPLDFPQLLETVRALLAEPPEVRLARRAGRTPRDASHKSAGPESHS